MFLASPAFIKSARMVDATNIASSSSSSLSSSMMNDIERVHVDKLSADEFVTQYLMTNRPVMIDGLINTWRATQEWRIPSSSISTIVTSGSDGPTPEPVNTPATAASTKRSNQPNFAHLRHHFGTSICQVAECAQRSYSEQKRSDMSLSNFLTSWENGDYSTPSTCRYLKDWHMTADYPKYGAYVTPPHFIDDWMNAYWDAEGKDDFRFVYMGPGHTWTPLHRDVGLSSLLRITMIHKT
jgi:hypothetical protein